MTLFIKSGRFLAPRKWIIFPAKMSFLRRLDEGADSSSPEMKQQCFDFREFGWKVKATGFLWKRSRTHCRWRHLGPQKTPWTERLKRKMEMNFVQNRVRIPSYRWLFYPQQKRVLPPNPPLLLPSLKWKILIAHYKSQFWANIEKWCVKHMLELFIIQKQEYKTHHTNMSMRESRKKIICLSLTINDI